MKEEKNIKTLNKSGHIINIVVDSKSYIIFRHESNLSIRPLIEVPTVVRRMKTPALPYELCYKSDAMVHTFPVSAMNSLECMKVPSVKCFRVAQHPLFNHLFVKQFSP